MNGEDHKAINKMYTEVAAFKATLQERNKWSEGFRQEVIGTLAEINTKLGQLPCRPHVERMDGVDRRIGWLFRFVILAFCGIGSVVTVFVLTHIGG